MDLTNKKIQNTYGGILNIGATGATGTTLYTVTDGFGNPLPIQVSASQINFTGTVTGITAGISGSSGSSGSSGTSGSSGISGTSGSSGSSGISGTSGSSGSSGSSGLSGDRFSSTSSTSLPIINNGLIYPQVETGLAYSPGQSVIVARDVDNYMIGEVVSYDAISGILEINVSHRKGSGTYSLWTVNLYGAAGASGSSGSSGVSGSSGSSGTSGAAGLNGSSGSSGTSGVSPSLTPGILTVAGGTSISSTLRAMTDSLGNTSPISFSNTLVTIGTNSTAGRLSVRSDGANPALRLEDNTGGAILASAALAQSGGASGLSSINSRVTINTGNASAIGTSTTLTLNNTQSVSYFWGQGSFSINGLTAPVFGVSTLTVGGRFFATGNILGTVGYAVNFSNDNSFTASSGEQGIMTGFGTFAAPAGSANHRGFALNYVANYSGVQTGDLTGFLIQATETNLNGKPHNLITANVNNALRFGVNNQGAISVATIVGSAAPNSTLFFDDTTKRLVWKDSAGNINTLY